MTFDINFWANLVIIIGSLFTGFKWLVGRLDKKFDRIESRLNDIDKRLTVVETRLTVVETILAMMGAPIKPMLKEKTDP